MESCYITRASSKLLRIIHSDNGCDYYNLLVVFMMLLANSVLAHLFIRRAMIMLKKYNLLSEHPWNQYTSIHRNDLVFCTAMFLIVLLFSHHALQGECLERARRSALPFLVQLGSQAISGNSTSSNKLL